MTVARNGTVQPGKLDVVDALGRFSSGPGGERSGEENSGGLPAPQGRTRTLADRWAVDPAVGRVARGEEEFQMSHFSVLVQQQLLLGSSSGA